MYMSGFFPCMMFGIPGAALAMVKCAKPAKKKAAIGLVASAAICSFICGVTEPFEFAFMFLSSRTVCDLCSTVRHLHHDHCCSWLPCRLQLLRRCDGSVFLILLPAAARIWLIIPLGIAAFVVFYFVFLFAIKKWDLEDPGRR